MESRKEAFDLRCKKNIQIRIFIEYQFFVFENEIFIGMERKKGKKFLAYKISRTKISHECV